MKSPVHGQDLEINAISVQKRKVSGDVGRKCCGEGEGLSKYRE
jgi:hypothetical protein